MAEKTVATNRKARHFFHIVKTYEAGIELLGSEVKALRQGQTSIAESYARIMEGEIFLINMHIAPYEKGSYFNPDPTRPRKLLLHSREIKRLIGSVTQRGFTLVPLRVYFNDRGYAKVELALAKGKKVYDRREDIKRRDLDREARRDMKK